MHSLCFPFLKSVFETLKRGVKILSPSAHGQDQGPNTGHLGETRPGGRCVWGRHFGQVNHHCQVEILENCGHSVVVERPWKSAKLIVDFLASVYNTDNNKKLD
uniref:Abhydrolase domain containing 6, acylglycerol lipase n=1 Tax=Rousettus aegyptiacus TaxID=9407 RepID=A0A7J8HMB6_ROUAE|nr:abhydrolase domain containing 6, acylglycerol lipase [Rousettus aegyptiacus]